MATMVSRHPAAGRYEPKHAISYDRQEAGVAARGSLQPDGAVAFAAGAALYDIGEAAGAVFVLLAGRVRLWNRAVRSGTVMTGLLRAGDVFGLDSLSAERYSEGASAETACQVRIVPVETVDRLLGRQPGLAARLLEALVRRRSAAEQLLARALMTGVSGRLAGALLDAAESGVVSGQTRQQLADAAWTTRETATRALLHFHAQGLVQVDGRTVSLRDVDSLRRLAGGFRQGRAA